MDDQTLDSLVLSRSEVCALVNKNAKTKDSDRLLRESDSTFWRAVHKVYKVDVSFSELFDWVRTPLFDKTSLLCFSVHSAHEFVASVLGAIYFPDLPGEPRTSIMGGGTKWLRRGGGWWISTMNTHEILTHENYKITDLDAPIFERFGKNGILWMNH